MIENVSTQLTVFHCFAHCLLPGRAFASLYALLFLEKEAEIGGRVGEHSAILSTFIKLPFVIKIFVLSIFEWPFYSGFTVQNFRNHADLGSSADWSESYLETSQTGFLTPRPI